MYEQLNWSFELHRISERDEKIFVLDSKHLDAQHFLEVERGRNLICHILLRISPKICSMGVDVMWTLATPSIINFKKMLCPDFLLKGYPCSI